ncbi:MAG: response regulator [candidate division Zixibacteria bacterium]|nr:response regulator [candidate division Zixibacteria bacterium]
MSPSAKILIVDDDPLLQELLNDTLSAVGYQTLSTSNATEALGLLQKSDIDLVITDIKMPDINGFQLLKLVRLHYPQMPVIFISGYATPEMISAAGPDGFLLKPFRIAQIEELIEKTLEVKRDIHLNTDALAISSSD